MKHFIRIGLFGLLLIGSVSCSETKLLTKAISKYPQSLGYELISPIDSSAKTDTVILSYNGFTLDSATTVKRVKSLVLPFLFINYVDIKYRIKLGATQLSENYNDFFFNALMDESDRSGRYALCYDSTRRAAVYSMEVTLDTCLTETHLEETYWTVFYVYGYFSTYSESSYPARSRLSCTLKLRKGDQVLKDTTVSTSKMLVFSDGNNLSMNERMRRTADCMVQTLCQNTRNCIAQMVQEVNGVLTNQKR